MRSMQLGTYGLAYDNVINATTGYLQVQTVGYWEQPNLNKSLADSDSLRSCLRSLSGVKALIPRLENFSLAASANSEARPALVRGIDPALEAQHFKLNEKIRDGRYLDSNDQAVILGEDLAENLALGIGDTLVLIGQGYHGISANGKFPVQAILDFKDPNANRQMVLMTLGAAQWLTGADKRLTALVVAPQESDKVAMLSEQINQNLAGSELKALSWRQMMPELIEALEADSAGGIVILIILYIVIGFGVFGTILMLSVERKPEFGILLSIGMGRGRLALTTFIETTFLGGLGALAGGLLAWPIAWYYYQNPIRLSGEMDQMMDDYGFEPLIPFSLDLSIWLNHSAIVLGLTILMSLYATFTIYRLKPVNAMRR
jgi:ABC-type lipoprotein release transport system permease subunit